MGGQEHFYLEPHGCIGVPGENDEIRIIASTQVHNAPHIPDTPFDGCRMVLNHGQRTDSQVQMRLEHLFLMSVIKRSQFQCRVDCDGAFNIIAHVLAVIKCLCYSTGINFVLTALKETLLLSCPHSSLP